MLRVIRDRTTSTLLQYLVVYIHDFVFLLSSCPESMVERKLPLDGLRSEPVESIIIIISVAHETADEPIKIFIRQRKPFTSRRRLNEFPWSSWNKGRKVEHSPPGGSHGHAPLHGQAIFPFPGVMAEKTQKNPEVTNALPIETWSLYFHEARRGMSLEGPTTTSSSSSSSQSIYAYPCILFTPREEDTRGHLLHTKSMMGRPSRATNGHFCDILSSSQSAPCERKTFQALLKVDGELSIAMSAYPASREQRRSSRNSQ